jgi:hypothetical protein
MFPTLSSQAGLKDAVQSSRKQIKERKNRAIKCRGKKKAAGAKPHARAFTYFSEHAVFHIVLCTSIAIPISSLVSIEFCID